MMKKITDLQALIDLKEIGDKKKIIIEYKDGRIVEAIITERGHMGWTICSDDKYFNGGGNEVAKKIGKKYGWSVTPIIPMYYFGGAEPASVSIPADFISEDDF